MNTNRHELREWYVYSKLNKNFHNMNHSSFNDDEFLKEIPTEGFTYEECERFMVHLDDKSSSAILNIKQPRFLLNFQLKLYEKEMRDKIRKSTQVNADRNHQIQVEAQQKRKTKQQFVSDYYAWEKMKTDNNIHFSKSNEQVQKERPKYTDYGLTESDFERHESRMIE